MKPTAIMPRTKMVNSKGRRFLLLSIHSALNSTLRFFFITMARRKGAISMTVSTPVMALAYQCSSHPGNNCRIKGSTKVNMMAILAELRMEYTTVLMVICVSIFFHLLVSVVFG